MIINVPIYFRDIIIDGRLYPDCNHRLLRESQNDIVINTVSEEGYIGYTNQNIRKHWPMAQYHFYYWSLNNKIEKNLGDIQITQVEHSIFVCSFVCKRGYIKFSMRDHIHVPAFVDCFRKLMDIAIDLKACIHYPDPEIIAPSPILKFSKDIDICFYMEEKEN